MPVRRPTRILVCAYPVGFGDCLLLTFEYETGGPRHVLVDFGTTARPASAPANLMTRIAEDIRRRCDGKLHAVVATHRHSDHISGFATAKNGKGSGDVIAACRPDLVLQPWTEDPKAATDAVRPTRRTRRMRGYVQALGGMHAVAGLVQAEARALRGHGGALGRNLAEELEFLGGTNLGNRSAVENLMRMGKRGKAVYAHHGSDSGLGALLPGVRVSVLGPPTLEQSDRIRKQRDVDPSEFWQLLGLSGAAAAAARPAPVFPRAPRFRTIPPAARWLRRKLMATRSQQMLQLVRTLDDAMNNTSLILLLEVGRLRLLLPGDAQIENWEYTLSRARTRPALRRRLASADLYKVGHHGSRNATPRTLWGWFEKRSRRETDARLWSVISTRTGKHGKATRNTEVPRGTLVAALEAETSYVTTQAARFRAKDTGVAPQVVELNPRTGAIRRLGPGLA